MIEYDPETLARFDGKDGKPVYIAHKGKVYDVSNSKLWKTGIHMRRHPAGRDLTTDIQAAPHGPEVLERVPQVGVLKEAVPERSALPIIEGLLHRYPMLRRHPHPMTVHFPIVFMMAAPSFNILYLLTGVKSFEVTALHCLGAGLLFTPLVMLTGLLTWRLNYLARPLKPINIKIAVSAVMLLAGLAAFFWRVAVPGLMDLPGAAATLYFLLTLSLIPMVGVIGWHGAMLTFPFERE